MAKEANLSMFVRVLLSFGGEIMPSFLAKIYFSVNGYLLFQVIFSIYFTSFGNICTKMFRIVKSLHLIVHFCFDLKQPLGRKK